MSRVFSSNSFLNEHPIQNKNAKSSVLIETNTNDDNFDINHSEKVKVPMIAHVATFLMLASGVLSVTSFKMQGEKYNFKHGVFQVFLMFVGEWVNLMIFGGRMGKMSVRENSLKSMREECLVTKQEMKFTKLWMALPCFLDTLGSTMSLVSLLLIPASL